MRFLAYEQFDGSGAAMGSIPQWYSDVCAAKYAGVSLEVWHQMPMLYQRQYLASMAAEAEAPAELRRFTAERQASP